MIGSSVVSPLDSSAECDHAGTDLGAYMSVAQLERVDNKLQLQRFAKDVQKSRRYVRRAVPMSRLGT